jgi:ribonuclease BN (tRNA processing enzyme)
LEDTYIWNGTGWSVEVLYSRAGVSTSILVTVNQDFHLLLDCGDGTLRDLLKREVDLKKVTTALISHGHFDHVGGLHSVLGFMRMIGRTSDFMIVTPKNSLEDGLIIEAFTKAYGDTIPFRINRREVTGVDELNINGIRIRPFAVTHHGSTEANGITARLPSLGCKLNYADETVVYTGDCGLNSRLDEQVSGADLAIIEATLDEPGGATEAKVHLSLENAIRLAETARAAFIVHRTKGKNPIKLGF